MFYDDNFYYDIISDDTFDTKYLSYKQDGSKYKKYILIYYKDGDEIKSEELPSKEYIEKFNNVLSFYEVEEIISSCIHFDNEFEYKRYYKIKDKICFVKYKYLKETEDIFSPEKNKDNETIRKILEDLPYSKN